MNTPLRLVPLLLISLHLQSALAHPHHATANRFDISRKVQLKGTIAKLDWANPHVHLSLDVRGERGVLEHWDVELGSPGALIVAGLSKDDLKPGTSVTFDGYPGKANSGSTKEFSLCATQITLADGATATFVVGI